MHWFWDGLLNLVFPPRCQVCLKFGRAAICDSCLAEIKVIEPPFCAICGRPFDPLAKAAPVCTQCRKRRWSFQWARAYGTYEGTLREAIHRFKYSGKRVLAEPLGKMLAERAGDLTEVALEAIDLICPVPLYPARKKERGFNQAELLSKVLAERTGLPIEAGLLQRTRDTQPQVDLPAQDRARNVRGAFAAAADAGRQPSNTAEQVKGKSILLVDDVLTTGATLNECAKMLRRAGASQVYVLTVARSR